MLQFNLILPVDPAGGLQLSSAGAIGKMATAAEAAGFTGLCLTEHPFPSERWLATLDGHHALDPFVGLAFAAAATSTTRLMTYLCVLPYRNPFLTAKSAMSLHVLSGGRLALGIGAGYLEDEFAALGVDFAERNELFDESLAALRKAWTESDVVIKGRHFEATGNTMLPRTASPPPILVGGNSRRAVRRAARLADGWLPLYNPAEVAASHHSPALDSVAALGALIDMALDTRAATRSSTPFEVVSMPFVPASPGEPGFQPDRVLTHLGELAEIGVTGVVIRGLGREVARVTDRIEEFAHTVIAPWQGPS